MADQDASAPGRTLPGRENAVLTVLYPTPPRIFAASLPHGAVVGPGAILEVYVGAELEPQSQVEIRCRGKVLFGEVRQCCPGESGISVVQVVIQSVVRAASA